MLRRWLAGWILALLLIVAVDTLPTGGPAAVGSEWCLSP